jgi:transposase
MVLVVDGASARRAKSLQVLEQSTLVSLPAYTSELNPAERLWPLVMRGWRTARTRRWLCWRKRYAALSKNHWRACHDADELSLVAGRMSSAVSVLINKTALMDQIILVVRVTLMESVE